jgi:hypothetical protein
MGDLSCDRQTGQCSGDPCVNVTCTAPQVCSPERGGCVDCLDDWDCPGAELCTENGFCGEPLELSVTDPLREGGPKFYEVVFLQAMVDCWNLNETAGVTNLCYIIFNETSENITENRLDSLNCDDMLLAEDFNGGANDLNQSNDIWGCGLFNNQELSWEANIPAYSEWEYCIWYLAQSWSDDLIAVDRCANYQQ